MKYSRKVILLTHAAATFFMLGIAWFIQIVHYPLLDLVPPASFSAYETANILRTAWIVIPLMSVEAATGLLLLWCRPQGVHSTMVWVGLGLLMVIWLFTLLQMAPLHLRLSQNFDAQNYLSLVSHNWIRTVAWSARACLVLRMLSDALH